MEAQLIAEIERRSVLYDRSVQACKKMSARDEAWREVAEIMRQSEAEVKKRWRTLRDSFMRFHRLQRIFGPKGKKKMWIYYNKMSFLIPHIEPRDYNRTIPDGYDGGSNEYNSPEEEAAAAVIVDHHHHHHHHQNNRHEQHDASASAAADMVSISYDMCETELSTPPPPPLPPPPRPPASTSSVTIVDGAAAGCPCAYNGMHHAAAEQQPTTMMMMMHPEQAAGGGGGGSGGGGDKRKRSDDPVAESDEHFALSCVAALRRLPIRKNAETRMRMLHVLYEAEYGEEPAEMKFRPT